MAMGLSPLGRGAAKRSAAIGSLHAVGAAAGGATVGAVIGLIGTPLSSDARPWIVGGAALFALWAGLRRPVVKLGRDCQVPRHWHTTMPLWRRYLTWGALLGSGLWTLIPHSAVLVVLAGEATAGPGLGAAAGGLFGLGRELPALVPLVRRVEDERASDLLAGLAGVARRANVALALLAGVALALAAA
jgi:hypothetical protein